MNTLFDKLNLRPQERRLVMVAGPSSSGKTTFAKRLTIQLRVLGFKPFALSLDDYFVEKGEAGMLGKFPIWIITLKARTGEASYDRIVISVRQDKTLILKQEDYGASGRLMRTTLYPKYAEISPGKFFPSQMLIVDELNKGEKSQVTMSELSTAKLPDKVFTKAFIEQVN